jgi:uncharacterized Tic20 family protein
MGMSEPTTTVIGPEERGLAVAAHLSGLAGYIVPLGGLLVPIIIWAVKSESRVISTIAKQALLLNVIVWVLGILMILPFLTVILIPVAILGWLALGLVAIVLPVIGAIKASEGVYYRYPLVGLTLS